MRDLEARAWILLSLLAAIALNPAVLFSIGASVPVALGTPLLAAAICVASHRRFGWRLPTIYVLNVVALVSLFFHAELVTRVRFIDYVMEDLYLIRKGFYFNRPLLASTLRDKEYTTQYLTNSDGYRIGATQRTEQRVDAVDWLFVGDSYTQGAQVQFEDLYTSLVYQCFPDKSVLNAGISGWGIHEELRYFEDLGKGLKPTLVVLQVSNFNDFMNVVARTADVSDHLMQSSHFVRLVLQNLKFQNPERLPLGRWTEPFYRTAEENRRFNIFFTPTSPEKERDIEEYARLFGLFVSAVRSSGAELLVVVIPTKEQVEFRYLEEVVSEFEVDPRLLDMDRPNRFLRDLAGRHGVALVDLLDAFRSSSSPPFFEFDEHLNVDGHALTADALCAALARHHSTGVRFLSHGFGGDRYPTYSERGDSILFQSFVDGNMELFIADTAFHVVRQITANEVDEGHAVVSPSGEQLAFTVGDPESHKTRVYLADRSGYSRRSALIDSSIFSAIPAFTPDGRHLIVAAWTAQNGSRVGNGYLAEVDLFSGVARRITPDSIDAWRPVVSRDSRRIAFIGKTGANYDLFELTRESDTLRRLTLTPYDEWDPQYSPNGEELVYAAREFGNWDLYVLNLETGMAGALTRSRGDEWDPVFSPKGDHVTFAGQFGLFGGIYQLRIRD